jgi:hypothetical protein
MHVHEMHQPNHASNAWYGQGAHQLLIIVGEQKKPRKKGPAEEQKKQSTGAWKNLNTRSGEGNRAPKELERTVQRVLVQKT